jgi:hypothetical protein
MSGKLIIRQVGCVPNFGLSVGRQSVARNEKEGMKLNKDEPVDDPQNPQEDKQNGKPESLRLKKETTRILSGSEPVPDGEIRDDHIVAPGASEGCEPHGGCTVKTL